MRIAAALVTSGLALATSAFAASPAQEKQFVDSYRKAYEGKDSKALVALLYTKGADPQALAFYRMTLNAEMGGKALSVELLDLTPQDRVKAESTQSLDGRRVKLNNGSASGTSEVFVGERDGKLWILVPAAAK